MFSFSEVQNRKIMDIQNSKEKEALSDNVLVSGKYVSPFQIMISLLFSEIIFKVLILTEVCVKEQKIYPSSYLIFSLTHFLDREHCRSKRKGVVTDSNDSSYKLSQFLGN